MIPFSAVQAWQDGLPGAARQRAMAALRELVGEIIQQRVHFLCGAGMSKSSSVPLAGELTARMVRQILFGNENSDQDKTAVEQVASKYSLETAAEAFRKTKGPTELNALIERSVAKGTGKEHAGHRALDYLASNGFIKKVYTTNFDKLIETGLGGKAVTITDLDSDLERLRQITTAQSELVPVLHLHGVGGGECLIVEAETFALDRPLARLMMADMVTHSFVWVGYSMSDLDVRHIFLEIRSLLARHKREKRPFVVLPLTTSGTTQAYEWRVADEIWSARGCRFIPGRAEDVLPAVVAQLRRAQSEDRVKQLVKNAGGDSESNTDIEVKTRELEQLAARTGANFDQVVEDIARQEEII
jgi:hypothetical protein